MFINLIVLKLGEVNSYRLCVLFRFFVEYLTCFDLVLIFVEFKLSVLEKWKKQISG